MHLATGKKIYFASDFHLGLPMDDVDKSREIRICEWLLSLEHDAQYIFLIGDLFDAWMEYKTVVPRGFVRFLGTLAYLKSKGIQIEIFTGNHDLWMTDYFQSELDIPVHHDHKIFEVGQHCFYLHHGDGLGPGDKGYKFLKSVLNNRFCQWLYRGLHPNWGLKLAQYFSRKGAKHHMTAQVYQGHEREWLYLFVQQNYASIYTKKIDYFIFGHRHLALDISIDNQTRYLNCGDWITLDSYVEYDGKDCTLKSLK